MCVCQYVMVGWGWRGHSLSVSLSLCNGGVGTIPGEVGEDDRKKTFVRV